MFRLPMAGLLLFALVLAGLFGEGCRNPSPVTTSSVTAASSIPFSPLSTSSSSAPAGAVSSSTTSTTLAPSTSTILITTTTAAVRLPPLAFDTARAMEHIRDLAIGIGIRPGGSVAEYKAAMYAADYLSEIGYDPVVTEVPLPNGKTSHNVTAVKNGASPLTVVVGAHLSTRRRPHPAVTTMRRAPPSYWSSPAT